MAHDEAGCGVRPSGSGIKPQPPRRPGNDAKSAFESFTPEGRLNDRAQAEAVVAAALPPLERGGMGQDPAVVAPPGELHVPGSSPRTVGRPGIGPRRLVGLVGPGRLAPPALAAVGSRPAQPRQEPGPWSARSNWRRRVRTGEESRRVRAVLRGVWRASSLVECVNSVARMQQARHRKMTQGLLDLKRLYWNLRRFRVGRRKDQTPYGLLGLNLPELSFWEFLKLTPEELRETTQIAVEIAVKSFSINKLRPKWAGNSGLTDWPGATRRGCTALHRREYPLYDSWERPSPSVRPARRICRPLTSTPNRRDSVTSSDTRPAALVTGAAGFIGSHLVRELLRLGRVRVVALDDLSGGYRHNVADGAEFVEASVTDHATLARLFDKHQFRYVYHLAAYAARGSRTSSGGSTTRTT